MDMHMPSFEDESYETSTTSPTIPKTPRQVNPSSSKKPWVLANTEKEKLKWGKGEGSLQIHINRFALCFIFTHPKKEKGKEAKKKALPRARESKENMVLNLWK